MRISVTAVVFAMSLSPDGTMLASAGRWNDPTVKLWDVTTRELFATLEGHMGRSLPCRFRPMAACSPREVTVRLFCGTLRRAHGFADSTIILDPFAIVFPRRRNPRYRPAGRIFGVKTVGRCNANTDRHSFRE